MDKSTLGQCISNLGQNMLKMAIGLRALKQDNCCCGGGFGGFGMGRYNNMSMMGSIFPGMGCGSPLASTTPWMPGGCGGYTGYMGMGGMDMSGIMAQITQGMSYEAGYNAMMRTRTGQQNPKADAVDKDYETKTAETVEAELGKIDDKKGEDVTISDLSSFTDKDKTKAAKKYREDLTKLGKSSVAKMDTNKDGYISKEEYLKENATVGKKSASNQFEAIDLNNDGVIDYKEMASSYYAMDAEGDDKKSDGIISAKGFKRFQDNTTGDEEKSTPESTKAEVDLMQQGWKKLFGSDEKKS